MGELWGFLQKLVNNYNKRNHCSRKKGHAGDYSSCSGSLTVCLNGFLEGTEKELHHVRDRVVLLF